MRNPIAVRSAGFSPRSGPNGLKAALRTRAGFTLFEVIVTLAIAALVMSALYVALFTQLRLAQSGRDIIQRSTTARNLLNRISADIANHLGPMSPWLAKNAPANGATSAQNQNTSATDSANTQSNTQSTTPTDSTTDPATQNNMTTATSGVFNVCVSGSNQYLRLSLTRFPRPGKEDEIISDLCRIEYWLVEGRGLARREVTRVTSPDEDVDAPSVAEPEKFVIGDNVEAVTFRYWDGSTWVDSWNGLEPGTDQNQTPLGPPAAIEITLKLRVRSGDQDQYREHQQVVAIRTANIVQQTTP
jgi:prepilin-type N-terminal cleavage/methylation domain-containing protein